MNRVRRALGAMKQAEMARLAAVRRASAAARAEAEALRQSALEQIVPDTASDMLAISRWQAHADARARAAEARAREIDEAARPLEAALARTIGRESVVERVISDHQDQATKAATRRSEGA